MLSGAVLDIYASSDNESSDWSSDDLQSVEDGPGPDAAEDNASEDSQDDQDGEDTEDGVDNEGGMDGECDKHSEYNEDLLSQH